MDTDRITNCALCGCPIRCTCCSLNPTRPFEHAIDPTHSSLVELQLAGTCPLSDSELVWTTIARYLGITSTALFYLPPHPTFPIHPSCLHVLQRCTSTFDNNNNNNRLYYSALRMFWAAEDGLTSLMLPYDIPYEVSGGLDWTLLDPFHVEHPIPPVPEVSPSSSSSSTAPRKLQPPPPLSATGQLALLLPPEIWHTIIELLPSPDVASLRLSIRAVSQLKLGERFWWGRFRADETFWYDAPWVAGRDWRRAWREMRVWGRPERLVVDLTVEEEGEEEEEEEEEEVRVWPGWAESAGGLRNRARIWTAVEPVVRVLEDGMEEGRGDGGDGGDGGG